MDWFTWIAISIAVGAFVESGMKNKKLEKRIKVLEEKIKKHIMKVECISKQALTTYNKRILRLAGIQRPLVTRSI